MNHHFFAVPFPLRAALTLGNNSRSAAAVAINLHPIYKPLKCRSPFLLAASACRTVGGTPPPPSRETEKEGGRHRGRERASKTERSALSYLARRCLLIALPAVRQLLIRSCRCSGRRGEKHTFCLFTLIER